MVNIIYQRQQNSLKQNHQLMWIGFIISIIFIIPFSAQVAPVWDVDPLLNSGEHKVVQPDLQKFPGTFTVATSFNVAFINPPRVIISLLGYHQSQPADNTIDLGFKTEITAITTTYFDNTATIYGTSMTYLRCFYMGVDYSATQFFTQYQYRTFASTDAVVNTAASSRSLTQFKANVAGQNYASAIADGHQIVNLVYLGGYKVSIGSQGIAVKLQIVNTNANNYEIKYETLGDAQIHEVTYYRISLDKTALNQPGDMLFQSWAIHGADGVETYQVWGGITTVDQFKYRNFIMGFKDVVIDTSYVFTGPVDFMLQFRQNGQMIYQCELATPTGTWNLNIPNYNYLNGLTFHLRVPKCQTSPNLKYVRSTEQCVNTCPNRSFQHPDYSSLCQTCHSTCLTCDSTASTSCLSCDSVLDHRQLDTSTNQCICETGYYEDITTLQCTACTISGCTDCTYNVAALQQECLSCDSSCLTCNADPSHCLSCDTSIRQLVGTSTCICLSGGLSHADGSCTLPSTLCGDGIKGTDEGCDDGNLQSEDGCSSVCSIETDHACTVYSFNNGTSLCYYAKAIIMKIKSVIKVLNANQVDINLDVQAPNCNTDKLKAYFQSLNALSLDSSRRILAWNTEEQLSDVHKSLISFASTLISISSASFTPTGDGEGTGTLTLQYYDDVDTLSNRQFTFVNSNSQQSSVRYFHSTPISSIALEDPYNNVPMIYYQESIYQSAKTISVVFLVLTILALIFFFVFAFLRKAVIPVETLIVFQLVYFSILGLKQVQIGLTAIAYYGKFTYGINFNLISDDLITCEELGKIYQQCNSIDNINVSAYLAIVLLMVGYGIQIYKDYQQKKIDEKSSSSSSQKSSQNQEQKEEKEEFQRQLDIIKTARKWQKTNTYELPPKVEYLSCVCLELSYGIFFITAPQFFITIFNQDSTAKIISIIFLAILAVFFMITWVGWFKLYPIKDLSFVSLSPKSVQKISIYKFFYLALFVYLLVWGLVLAIAPGMVSYIFAIVWVVFWGFLIFKKRIYRNKYNKIRSVINQVITIIIAIVYITIFVSGPNNGITYAIILLSLVSICLVVNIFFAIYIMVMDKKLKKMMDKNTLDIMKYASQSAKSESTERRHGDFRDVITSQKTAIMMQKQMRTILKSKVNELKTLKKDMMMLMNLSANDSNPATSDARRKNKLINMSAIEEKGMVKNQLLDEQQQYNI